VPADSQAVRVRVRPQATAWATKNRLEQARVIEAAQIGGPGVVVGGHVDAGARGRRLDEAA
jgi:hypothetical protein